MHTNANLSADERERLAYIAGDPCGMELAEALDAAAEVQARLNGIEDHGIYDEQDAAALNGDLETEREARELADERVQELENVLAVVQEALEDRNLRMVKAMRARLADALESVRIGAGYSGDGARYVRDVIDDAGF